MARADAASGVLKKVGKKGLATSIRRVSGYYPAFFLGQFFKVNLEL
jgi:hypothetical protein